jgi:hypothetical protein
MRSRSCTPVELSSKLARAIDGMDGKKRSLLKSRKYQWGNSEVDKWRNIWRILFPDDPDTAIPDPELRHVATAEEEFQLFRSFASSQLPPRLRSRVEETLRKAFDEIVDNEIDAALLEKFEAVLRKTIEATFREEIEATLGEFQSVGGTWENRGRSNASHHQPHSI